jgi:hypothetical protein
MILSSHNNVLCVFLNVILGNPILRMVFYNVVFFYQTTISWKILSFTGSQPQHPPGDAEGETIAGTLWPCGEVAAR